LRWNRNTNFEDNHFYDFEHASAALTYCDAFFTEGFISNLANARHIALGGLNGCRVTANVGKAVDVLEDLIGRWQE